MVVMDAKEARRAKDDGNGQWRRIIGEAARRTSVDFRAAHPDLPWQSMIQMRNVMIHQYDGVDPTIVWDTV